MNFWDIIVFISVKAAYFIRGRIPDANVQCFVFCIYYCSIWMVLCQNVYICVFGKWHFVSPFCSCGLAMRYARTTQTAAAVDRLGFHYSLLYCHAKLPELFRGKIAENLYLGTGKQTITINRMHMFELETISFARTHTMRIVCVVLTPHPINRVVWLSFDWMTHTHTHTARDTQNAQI